jgi:hypothetical protein
LRLLLDEHYSPKIAELLRERGHDAAAASERDDLRGAGDRDVWTVAVGERRAILTENVSDFVPLARESAANGERHFGVVFTSARSLPRGAGTVGLYVESLDFLFREHAAVDALADQIRWLQPAV